MHNVLVKRQAILFTVDHVMRAYIYKEKEKISIYNKTRLKRPPTPFYTQTLIIHKNINGLAAPYFIQKFILVRIPTKIWV